MPNSGWSNWSGHVTAEPQLIAAPADVDELARSRAQRTRPVRVVGAGHSFTPLVKSEGTILSLERFEGLVLRTTPASCRRACGAGTRLGPLAELLHGIGQGLPNMGDIDKQALGGALGTATHGSGADARRLSHAARSRSDRRRARQGPRLRPGNGSRDDRTRSASSLGAFGVLTEVT